MTRRLVSVMVGVAVGFASAVGCSRSSRDFTPSPLKAEEALRKALDAWKANVPVGAVPNTSPPVHVVDQNRKEGQLLRAYRILGEKAVPSGRTFTVVLELEEPTEEIRTYYHVVGIDPLWVFRKEDYELLSHWDHYMPEEEKPVADVSLQEQPASQTSVDEP